MSDQEIKINLCYYDPKNPNNNLDAYEDEDRPQPRTEGCCCDNCFYGRDKLAMQLIESKRERDEAREKAERYRREANKFMLQRDESQEKYATEATEHMLAVNKLCNERDEAQADCLEQARLLGMGSEREARLIFERDDALSQIAQAECRAERFCQERDIAEDERIDMAQQLESEKECHAHCQNERDEAREVLEEETKFHHRTHIELIQTQCKLLDMEMQRDEARDAIVGWENKWKFAIDMAARAELERDDALNKLNDLKDILR